MKRKKNSLEDLLVMGIVLGLVLVAVVVLVSVASMVGKGFYLDSKADDFCKTQGFENGKIGRVTTGEHAVFCYSYVKKCNPYYCKTIVVPSSSAFYSLSAIDINLSEMEAIK